MDTNETIAYLQSAVMAAEAFAGAANEFAPGKVAAFVAATTEIAENIAERAKEGSIVFKNGDAATVKDITKRLAKLNDSLAADLGIDEEAPTSIEDAVAAGGDKG